MKHMTTRSLDPYADLLVSYPQFACQVGAAREAVERDTAVIAVQRILDDYRRNGGRGAMADVDGLIQISPGSGISRERVQNTIFEIQPWRKGPFAIDDFRVDGEWRSDMKWDRVVEMMPALRNRRICDVGANNGYYLFRMLEHEPELAFGIDPAGVYFAQYQLLRALGGEPPVHLEPVGVEALKHTPGAFDVIFLMGILYHHSDPVDVLRTCGAALRKGGQIVLETIVVEGEDDVAWFPESRYTGARGFYFLPTVSCLKNWIRRSSLNVVEMSDRVPTTPDEQRSTDFRKGASLAAGLADDDGSTTVEGYPAPERVIWLLER